MFARDADDAVSSGESGGRTAPSSGSSASALRVLLLLVVWATSVVPATGQPQPGTVNARSSPIAITPSGRTLLTVNPDSNSLTLVDTESLQVKAELSVGLDPRAVAVAPHGSWAVVASQGSDSISVIDLEASTVRRTIEVGDRPVGVAVSPGGDLLAVAELGADRVRLLDTATWNTCGLYTVGDRPHGLAFTPDGGQLLITHLLRGEVTVLTVEPRRVYLPLVLKQCSPRAAAGITSQESASVARTTVATIPTWSNVAPAPAIAVNRSGTRAYLPQTMAHGLGLNTQFDNTVFPKISVLNLEAGLHQTSEHISLPETDQPVGLPWDCVLARDDQELWVVNAGSNDVSIIDISDPRRPRRQAHLAVGQNPRGIVLHPDGTHAYVNNVLDGTMSVMDTQAYTVTETILTTRIPLPPVLLLGKQLFHSSASPKLAQARWISCNTCHVEGEHDGRTWLLQYAGQVPLGAQAVITRNTTSLLGMVETYPLRWSAEWDESADSEFSIRFEQFGTGLIQGDMHPTLGAPNQGRSWELDCLASFIDSLPIPERSHELTAAESRGRALFESQETGCLSCHPAPLYTDLRAHDVGTASAYGEWFGSVIDTPTLRFLYDSAPYVHDGSAATLREVLATSNPDDPHNMNSVLTEDGFDDLVAFLEALPYAPDEGAFTYQASGCLATTRGQTERIDIWVEGSDIVMAHHGAVYNCCASVVVYHENQNPLLQLVEREEYHDSEPCRCLCPYDLGARLSHLSPGAYQVQVLKGATGAVLIEETVVISPSSAQDSAPAGAVVGPVPR